MKAIKYTLGIMIAGLSFTSFSQEANPDQNPNHAISAEKYAQQADVLTASQSTTVQDTYKAYDWREYKAEKKQERRDRRYEFRKMRFEARNRCCNRYGNRNFRYGYYPYNNSNSYSPYNVNPYYYSPNLGACPLLH